ncbi:RDD family protein [Pelagirhabdus alkalitolerans]|nr:RDD family protein [Pelagirhabdus alkalitolerans]
MSPVDAFERILAIIIDFNFLMIGALLINWFVSDSYFVILVVFAIFYNILLPRFWHGYTIGKRAVGIRIVHLQGKKLTLPTLIVREFLVKSALYSLFLGLLPLISIILVGMGRDKRAIHDFVARTYVTSRAPE